MLFRSLNGVDSELRTVVSACPEITVTVRPEWIKFGDDTAGSRSSEVEGTVMDVVYLGSVTQLMVVLRTGEHLTVHRLNDEVGAEDPRPGEPVTLRWAAEHSFVLGEVPGRPTEGGADVAHDVTP